MLTEFHLGIDDTDSRLGGCTTYTAALIFDELASQGLGPSDYPWLVRLNPNIPWKTRGNGALAIHLRTDYENLPTIKQLALDIVGKTSDPSIPGTDPAVVFLRGPIPSLLKSFTTKALHDVIRVKEACGLIKKIGAEAHAFGNQRGIVGALAAVGYGPERDYTYEIIAYRSKPNLGKPRRIVLDSIRRMDSLRRGTTFNSVDPETGRVLVSPHGPDPVLLGVRGEHPVRLLGALREVELHEPIERVMLFRTNQGTDAHLEHQTSISSVKPFQSVVIVGTVVSAPLTVTGGHVIFSLVDDTGTIDCAAYKPTGKFREAALQLLQGDEIKVSGGVRLRSHNCVTLNLEKMEVLRLAMEYETPKLSCSSCGASCESMGKDQGVRCRKCGLRLPRSLEAQIATNRNLKLGVYTPPPRANRHLTKPESRCAQDRDDGQREERENSALSSYHEQILSQLAKLRAQ